jgi:hypothetical protein
VNQREPSPKLESRWLPRGNGGLPRYGTISKLGLGRLSARSRRFNAAVVGQHGFSPTTARVIQPRWPVPLLLAVLLASVDGCGYVGAFSRRNSSAGGATHRRLVGQQPGPARLSTLEQGPVLYRPRCAGRQGLVTRGPGRGGVVRRAHTKPPTGEQMVAVVVEVGAHDTETIEAAITNEIGLYEPMRAVIEGDWARDHRQDLLAVEITALGGSRPTGIWSRPDIVTVEVRTFEYVPGKYLQVNTFEIKSPTAINVQAVYEALAHRRAATRSYVLLYIPSEMIETTRDAVQEVSRVARTHGIGVITAADPTDYGTWEEVEEAQRVEPDPERLNDFIAEQLSVSTRSLISRRLRWNFARRASGCHRRRGQRRGPVGHRLRGRGDRRTSKGNLDLVRPRAARTTLSTRPKRTSHGPGGVTT